MELPEHGGDAATLDGLVAPGTQAAAQAVVVGLAVREALVLKKLSVPERLPTLPAHKTLWVPLKEGHQLRVIIRGHLPADSARKCNCL